MKQVKRLFYKSHEQHDHIDVEIGEDIIGIEVSNSFTSGICPNCRNPFSQFQCVSKDAMRIENTLGDAYYDLFHCKTCGWWQLKQSFRLGKMTSHYAYQFHSILDTVDIASDHIDLIDLKKYLLLNWEDRKYISAGRAEALVKDILKEHLSCDVFFTTANVNTPDKGVDL